MILSLADVTPADRGRVGGKCAALAELARSGVRVPEAVCLSTGAYESFLAVGGLQERIQLELNRKDFEQMRWEELWDASLRIRNLFLTAPVPAEISRAIADALQDFLPGGGPFVVRSSALAEDSATASFAGIHESFVNVRGVESVIENVRKVWASLWSDAALLYRQELGLDPETSAMAVVIQRLVEGECSGVAFSRSPSEPSQVVVESVYGLNQGLVDGAVEPDRWFIGRDSGCILGHQTASREVRVVSAGQGVAKEPLPPSLAGRPPLAQEEVRDISSLALRLERLFGAPQDVEWTVHGGDVYVLQSRPITSAASPAGDEDRRWYLGLRRSLDTLKSMRQRIEHELIPEMIRDGVRLAETDPATLSDPDLATEIQRREGLLRKWQEVYREEFIPFAHGVRLFGQFYNDTVKPSDPYEFMDLLVDTGLESVDRNRMLEEMAGLVREDTALEGRLRAGEPGPETGPFSGLLGEYLRRHGGLTPGAVPADAARAEVLLLVQEMAAHPPVAGSGHKTGDRARREEVFLSRFVGEARIRATELLDLARTSHRLRDNDNIYLERIERQLATAREAGRDRLAARGVSNAGRGSSADVAALLRDPARPLLFPEGRNDAAEAPVEEASRPPSGSRPDLRSGGPQALRNRGDTVEEGYGHVTARQMIGQPAGPGLARGRARVLREPSDRLDFRSGEILVCDAVDPCMTFLIPLAAGIVERRGGMLIHGAIIAREYGLPCVTGVPHATDRIRTGDRITVDGYLGIVIQG